jgi:hypothetical protein
MLTAPQSNPQSQNPSQSRHCKYGTTQKTSKIEWRRHKQLKMYPVIWTRRTMSLITQVTSLTRPRDAKCRRRMRKRPTISRRKELSRRRHERSRHRHMRTSGGSRLRAVLVLKVVRRASLAVGGNMKPVEGDHKRSGDLVRIARGCTLAVQLPCNRPVALHAGSRPVGSIQYCCSPEQPIT